MATIARLTLHACGCVYIFYVLILVMNYSQVYIIFNMHTDIHVGLYVSVSRIMFKVFLYMHVHIHLFLHKTLMCWYNVAIITS